LLSGDTLERVAATAKEAGFRPDEFHARQSPRDKITHITLLKSQGRKVLMAGDGLNDAPALAAGHASISPATAADIIQTAADVIWQGSSIHPVLELLSVARASRIMALQNFGVALAYNAVCIPLAMLGYVTPLIAALAMSSSSILVTANALRLRTKTCRLGRRRL
jgi:Cu2+-exporting ATPase